MVKANISVNVCRVLWFASSALLSLVLSACSSNRLEYKPGPDRSEEHDRQNIPEPEVKDPVLAWQSMDRTFWRQGEELLDLDRDFRKLVGRPKEAFNINRFDGVSNSSWFTNRLGSHPTNPAEIAADLNLGHGPDTSGSWTVFRPKVQGFTPGFWIKDKHGDSYIIKFDPDSNPELATAAATMGSRYFRACGYNAPEETIVIWRPEQLVIEPGIRFTDRSGKKREFTQTDLDEIIARVHKQQDGSIRSLASKVLDGKAVGPFSFDGRRSDDPNDWCPHEHRRELRALYVVASFINQYDTKDQNTLDTYVDEGGHSFIRHNLIDFGSTFGSNGDRAKNGKIGYCNVFDLRDMMVSWVTLGLKKWSWEDAQPYQYKSIGYFESKIFEPDKWDPIVPNPAFENMTPRDAYWGAKIVMAWRDEQIRALVESGQYSDPQAKDYMIRTLIERRDKIGRHWFSKVAPLEEITLSQTNGKLIARFLDLAVLYGMEDGAATRYGFSISHRGKAIVKPRIVPEPEVIVSAEETSALIADYRPDRPDEDSNHLYELRIHVRRNQTGPERSVALWLWYHPEESRFELVGIEHLY